MLLKKALFLYFFIALIFLVAVIILNSTQKDRWLNKLPPQEQKLYKLEKEALLSSNELDMNKAKLYYEERNQYCQSLEDQKQQLCFKRTQPFWDNLYKKESNPHGHPN